MQNKKSKRQMGWKDIFAGFSKPRKKEILKSSDEVIFNEDEILSETPKKESLKIREDEKITVEIAEVVRIRPQDFSALKSSFEEWASTWD
jgi:hypothetical protein